MALCGRLYCLGVTPTSQKAIKADMKLRGRHPKSLKFYFHYLDFTFMNASLDFLKSPKKKTKVSNYFECHSSVIIFADGSKVRLDRAKPGKI